MRTINATVLSDFARMAVRSASAFAGLVHNLILDVRDSYRPKLHHTRGPGPKWRTRPQPWQAAALARIDSEGLPLTEHEQKIN